MDTRFILLWLEGPLQSWGYDSKFGRRDTLDFPTKSGVMGLVLCAMGASGEQVELLARFADLKQTVISFRHGNKTQPDAKQPTLHDFQMIGAGYDEKDIWQTMLIPKKADGSAPVGGGTKLTHRYYLQDAVFAVLLETPADIADSVADALQNPVYDIYLGRKCCVPSEFVYQGMFATEAQAEQVARTKAAERDDRKLYEDFRVIDGDSPDGDAFTLNDVPVQFGTQKKYRDRRVTKIQKES